MKIMRKLAAALLAAALAAALAVPSLAAFDQDTLNGIVLIRTGAPDENGVMNYWRGTGFFVGEAGRGPGVHRHQLPCGGGVHPGRQGPGRRGAPRAL